MANKICLIKQKIGVQTGTSATFKFVPMTPLTIDGGGYAEKLNLYFKNPSTGEVIKTFSNKTINPNSFNNELITTSTSIFECSCTNNELSLLKTEMQRRNLDTCYLTIALKPDIDTEPDINTESQVSFFSFVSAPQVSFKLEASASRQQILLIGNISGGDDELLYFCPFKLFYDGEEILSFDKLYASRNGVYIFSIDTSVEDDLEKYQFKYAFETSRGLEVESATLNNFQISNPAVNSSDLEMTVTSQKRQQNQVLVTVSMKAPDNWGNKGAPSALFIERTVNGEKETIGSIATIAPTASLENNTKTVKVIDYLPPFEECSYGAYLKIGNTIYRAPDLSQPLLVDEEDIVLTAPNGDSLNVKYNPKIGSFKSNLKDSISETLGGRYPIVKRNGYMDYKTFTLNGLIYSEMGLVNKSGVNKVTTVDHEFLQEKRFRDAVIDFLKQDQPLLFRSMTEGKMLVKLTNISLTPEERLGRRIYSFSATVTEVNKTTPNTLSSLGFVSVEER